MDQGDGRRDGHSSLVVAGEVSLCPAHAPAAVAPDLGSAATAELFASLRIWAAETPIDDADPETDSASRRLARCFRRWDELRPRVIVDDPSRMRARYVNDGGPYDELAFVGVGRPDTSGPSSGADASSRSEAEVELSPDSITRQVALLYFRDAWEWVETYAMAAQVEVIPNASSLFADLWRKFGDRPRPEQPMDPGRSCSIVELAPGVGVESRPREIPAPARRVLTESLLMLRSVGSSDMTSGLASAIAGGLAAVDAGVGIEDAHRAEICAFLAQILPVRGSLASSLELLLLLDLASSDS